MPKFSYRALNARGRPVRGVVTAANESDLFSRLEESGLMLIDCKEQSGKAGMFAAFSSKKVPLRDLMQMFVHLEQVTKAGVPLLEGLSDIRNTTESPRLRDVMGDVYRDVAEGSSFSNALAKQPAVFKAIFVSLINAGEETGKLSNAFTQVIKHLKWTDAMESKIKKASRYPKILVAVVIGVVWVMMGYVVPQVTGFLKDMGQELPPVTIALIATSAFITDYFLYIAGALALGYAAIKAACIMSESFRYRVDYLILRTPVIGPVVRKVALSQFCQTFGVLFTSGLEILKCMDSAKGTTDNMAIAEALELAKQRVQEGLPLSTALQYSGEFPTLVVRMLRVGEETGNLTGVLDQVSEFYDKDVNETVDTMIQMIEPMLTAILGAIILWIAAAVFGPIYNSLGSMGK